MVKDGLKQAVNIVKDLNKCLSRFFAAQNASVTKRLGHYEESRTFLMASALNPCFKLKRRTTEEYTFLRIHNIHN